MKIVQKKSVNLKLQPLWAVVFTMFAFVFLVSPAKAQQIRIGKENAELKAKNNEYASLNTEVEALKALVQGWKGITRK